MNQKHTYDEKQIKALYDQGISIRKIALQLGIPNSTLRGYATHWKWYNKDEICTCCGFRKRAKGYRFLCSTCFRECSEAF
jgi:uncharacterized protein YjcR